MADPWAARSARVASIDCVVPSITPRSSYIRCCICSLAGFWASSFSTLARVASQGKASCCSVPGWSAGGGFTLPSGDSGTT